MTVSRLSRPPLAVWALAALCLVLVPYSSLHAQSTPPDADRELRLALEAVRAGETVRAKQILLEAFRAFPGDPRIPTELAGLAFLENDFQEAKRRLHQARRLGTNDPYVREFLGTLYLLEGNVEAALTFWNPLRRPIISETQTGTGLERILRAGLAADAAGFPAGSPYLLEQYRRSLRTIELLGVCGASNVSLEAAENETYVGQVRCIEKSSFGQNRIATAIMLARGLAYRAVHIQFPDIGQRAISIKTMARWDPRKRRIWLEAATPIAGRASWRLRSFADARHEYWQMLQPGDRRVAQAFLHRRWEVGAAVEAIAGPNTLWENRIALSGRSFPVAANFGAEESRLTDTASVLYAHRIEHDLARLPAQRIFLTAEGEASFERYFSADANVYRGQGSLRLSWHPPQTGDDGLTTIRLSAGGLSGSPPLTELFAIGLERDGAIPLRAHVGTSDGRKGSALYGNRYLAANLDVRKSLLRTGILDIALVPFLDMAWVRDRAGIYGAQKTQWDAGIQLVASTPGGTEIRLSYGWDLRRGDGAFYALTRPYP